MCSVVVLLSSYNGARYINEQLDSLLKQEGVDIKIIIRDDGSSDDTKELLSRIGDKRIECHFCENVGVRKSFLELLRLGKEAGDAKYFAFCDQDDVWLPDKLVTAVKALDALDADLYYSSFTTVDSNLNVIQENVQHHSPDRLGAALVNLAVTGCTMVFSRRLLDAATEYTPARIMMHDSWLYKIALALDYTVVYDPVAHIYYRQHANNVIGDHNSIVKKWRNRYRRWFRDVTNDRYCEAEELYKGYSPIMSQTQLSILSPVICYRDKSFLQRLKIAFNPAYKTGKIIVDISFKLSILAKKY